MCNFNQQLDGLLLTAPCRPPMSLRQLSSRGSFLLSHGGSAVGRAGFRGSAATSYPRHPQHLLLPPPVPPPCWSSRGPPSWPPRSHPAASQLPSVRAAYLQGFSLTCCPRGLRSVFTCAGRRMEQAYRGPPHKRRKSMEDKDRTKEGAAGSSKTEAERYPQPNHRLKHGGPEDPRGTRPGSNAFKENCNAKSVEQKRVGGVGEGGGATRGSSRQSAGGAGGLQVEDSRHTHTSWSAGQESQRRRTHFPPQHLQSGSAAGEPPPPGTSPPVTHLEAQPVQRKVTAESSQQWSPTHQLLSFCFKILERREEKTSSQ